MIDIENLKAIPIEKVAVALGFQISRGSSRCRLPGHNDRNPSFSIRSKTNRFHCYACNRGGDTIELVRIMRSLDFLGACRWLNDQFGMPAISTVRYKRKTRMVTATPGTPIKSIAPVESPQHDDPDVEVFSFLLDRSPLRAEGTQYLHSRMYSRSTIERFKVGQIEDSQKLYRELISEFGVERLERNGLSQLGRNGRYFPIRSGYLLFPFLEKGLVTYVQARAIKPENGPRWLCPAKLKPPVFNLDALSQEATSILICEGVTDVLSAHQLKISSIGLIGASARLDLSTIERLKGRNVAVLGDKDAAGAKFARRIVDILCSSGIAATTKSVPDGASDLNDYLCREGNRQ